MRPRSWSLLLGSVGAWFAIGAACSPFASAPPVADADAGADAAMPHESGAPDSAFALPPTPGKVECFGAICNAAMGEACCFDVDGGTTHCARTCPFGDPTFTCDEASDCAPGRSCCVGVLGSTKCEMTCSSGQLCHTDSECGVGSACVLLSCRGSVLGACRPVATEVKAFCNAK